MRREVPHRRDWPTVRGGSCDIACLRGEDGNFERSPLEKGDGDGWCLVVMDLENISKKTKMKINKLSVWFKSGGGNFSWLEEMAAFFNCKLFSKDIAKQPNSQPRSRRRPSRGPQSFGPLVPSNWRMRDPLWVASAKLLWDRKSPLYVKLD